MRRYWTMAGRVGGVGARRLNRRLLRRYASSNDWILVTRNDWIVVTRNYRVVSNECSSRHCQTEGRGNLGSVGMTRRKGFTPQIASASLRNDEILLVHDNSELMARN